MVWFISIIVLFFVSLAVAFIAYDEGGKVEGLNQNLAANLAQWKTRAGEDEAKVQAISSAVGWYDKTSATAETKVESLSASLKELKDTFADLSQVKDLEEALPVVIQAYNQRGREIALKNDEIASLKSEKETLDASLRQALGQKDSELADLRRQFDDSVASASAKQSEQGDLIATLRAQLATTDADLRGARGQIEAGARKYTEDEVTWKTRNSELNRKLAFTKQPATADAEVLAVSNDVSLGWIDIGAQQRLARGMRFQVVSGRVGSTQVKGWAEVNRVEADRAEVMFSGLADPFDPVVPGDEVFNPLYDPHGHRNAVLAGRFSVPNETEVVAYLQNMGITVQKNLDLTTDYLIVGSDVFVDEDGNQLEEAKPPTELKVYKNAEALGVQITPIKDLRSYFKF
jgi:hypothetical protein